MLEQSLVHKNPQFTIYTNSSLKNKQYHQLNTHYQELEAVFFKNKELILLLINHK